MLKQSVRNRQPTALQGVGLILLIALAVFAGSAFFTLMQKRIGALSSALFIAYGCAIAWFLLNWYGLSFVYTATDDVLRICRAYGKRERFAAGLFKNSPGVIFGKCFWEGTNLWYHSWFVVIQLVLLSRSCCLFRSGLVSCQKYF